MKIVYLSAVPWLSISQRPHFFAKYALTHATKELLWIEPYPSRFPGLSDLTPGRHAPEPAGLDLIEGLQLTRLGFVAPVEPIPSLFKLLNQSKIKKIIDDITQFISEDTILVIGKPCLLATMLIKQFKWRQVWYDAMDDFPSFYSGVSKRNTANLEKEIAQLVDRIFCSSHELIKKFSSIAPDKTMLVLNACSDDMQKPHLPAPSNEKIKFGYIGTIASWFDWNWVIELATKNPEAIINLVGPRKTRIPENLPKNIILEPPIPHPRVMEKISTFDYVIIPFLQNDITKYVDPVKFYEYRLAGKTILSTPFGEMLWHHKDETCCPDEMVEITIPDNTLVFPSPKKSNDIPRWSGRFSHVFTGY
ncbi:glycosyltransferase [Serratia marcescens]|uniref:Glycosyltransferase n=1 Tax=Serratia marcescens TaxID=615 RepID=A0A1Q4P6R4_SERMA|nr:glycosyltransferase [Serratia marcescens]OKB68762.1 glycosyltransferase [Serratia marcescens]